MRRRRFIRGGYRSGIAKKSKKKIVIRVLFVILCAAALTAASVLLGAYLKTKAEHSTAKTESVTESAPTPVETSEPYPDGIPSVSDTSGLSVCAADIDITKGSVQSVYDRLSGLSDTYNAVSVRLVSDGKLVYVSPALLQYVGVSQDKLPEGGGEEAAPEDDEESDSQSLAPAENVFANLSAVAEGAKKANLRLSAIYTVSPEILSGSDEAISDITKDKLIFGELVSLGFDEIIIDGLATEDEELSGDKLRSIVTYLAKLRSATGECDIGLTLPASVYLIPQMASKIKTLSEYADFLSIGIYSESDDPEIAYSLVYENCYSLKGNFSVYNIRGVIEEENPEVAAAIYASLKDMSVTSFQFTVYIPSPSFTPNEGAVVESDTVDYKANENALRAEDYAVSASSEQETDPED